MQNTVPFLLLACIFVAGCATPSNNPREGGLIGYLATGESGYQARLAQRRAAIRQEQTAAEGATAEHAALEAKKQERAAALARLEADQSRMLTELDGLEKEVAGLTTLAGERAAERDQLLAQLTNAQAQVKALQGTPAASVANGEARLAELQAEVKALRHKASLLLGQ